MPSFSAYVGWDIGGAHLKTATINHQGTITSVEQIATPLWLATTNLEATICQTLEKAPDSALHCVTMTAELCDVFKDRNTGVIELTRRLEQCFKPKSFWLYAGERGFIRPKQVSTYLADIASANWHATASFAAQHLENGILIDIGSTTTDLIPFKSGRLISRARNDHERMRQSELVYTGVIRTPVMAVVQKIFYADRWQPIIAENFATMADVYRLTRALIEQDDLIPAADGADKSQVGSARRLARMAGLDFGDKDDIIPWQEVAKYIANVQMEKINQALLNILSRAEVSGTDLLLGAGAGQFMIKKLACKHDFEYREFADLLAAEESKHQITRCATAVSVAQIARLVC